jgi:hypothetical protein
MPVASTVALVVLLLLQTPPEGVTESVVVLPAHITNDPPKGDGTLFTVTDRAT